MAKNPLLNGINRVLSQRVTPRHQQRRSGKVFNATQVDSMRYASEVVNSAWSRIGGHLSHAIAQYDSRTK